MSRYIDTKWLEDNAKEYSLGYYESDEWATPLSALDDAPSIDIVRCGECSKRKKNGFCLEHNRYERNNDGFCSYGEVSEKPTGSEKPNNSTTEDCSDVGKE